MVQFKQYTTQSGEIRYQFQTYLGKDPHTGKVEDVDSKQKVQPELLIQD